MTNITQKKAKEYGVSLTVLRGKLYNHCDANRFYKITGFLCDIQAFAMAMYLHQAGCDQTLYYK